jgi:hypothetical protein
MSPEAVGGAIDGWAAGTPTSSAAKADPWGVCGGEDTEADELAQPDRTMRAGRTQRRII